VVLRQIDEAKAAVKHGNDVPSGHVTVGLPTSTSRILALPLLQSVAKHVPNVTLELVEASNADLAEFVALQRIDLAVAMDVQPQSNMHTIPLLDETLLFVGHPIAPKGSDITLKDVAALPLLLPSFPNSIRVIIDRAFINASLTVQLVAETSAVSILLASVGAGMGWTILPWSALSGTGASAGITSHRITDVELKRRMSLCISPSARLSLACNAIESLLVKVIIDLVKSGKWQGVDLLPSAESGTT
jgi:LysR family nitrogen assimilation transcriptional regulator